MCALLCVHKPQPSALDSNTSFNLSSILGISLNLRLSLKTNLIIYPHLILILHPHLRLHIVPLDRLCCYVSVARKVKNL